MSRRTRTISFVVYADDDDDSIAATAIAAARGKEAPSTPPKRNKKIKGNPKDKTLEERSPNKSKKKSKSTSTTTTFPELVLEPVRRVASMESRGFGHAAAAAAAAAAGPRVDIHGFTTNRSAADHVRTLVDAAAAEAAPRITAARAAWNVAKQTYPRNDVPLHVKQNDVRILAQELMHHDRHLVLETARDMMATGTAFVPLTALLNPHHLSISELEFAWSARFEYLPNVLARVVIDHEQVNEDAQILLDLAERITREGTSKARFQDLSTGSTRMYQPTTHDAYVRITRWMRAPSQ